MHRPIFQKGLNLAVASFPRPAWLADALLTLTVTPASAHSPLARGDVKIKESNHFLWLGFTYILSGYEYTLSGFTYILSGFTCILSGFTYTLSGFTYTLSILCIPCLPLHSICPTWEGTRSRRTHSSWKKAFCKVLMHIAYCTCCSCRCAGASFFCLK